MAGELILRWYPVDGRVGEARYQSLSAGLCVESQTTVPPYYQYNSAAPTMAEIGSEFSVGGDTFGPQPLGSGAYSHAYAASVAGFYVGDLVEGQYAEKTVVLLSHSQEVIPVTMDMLPLSVELIGFGEPNKVASEPEIWGGYSYAGSGGGILYAGGALQIGMYDGGEFAQLAVVWISGNYFQAKEDGSSWTNPVLPQATRNVTLDEERQVIKLYLESNRLAPPFWTALVSATESAG